VKTKKAKKLRWGSFMTRRAGGLLQADSIKVYHEGKYKYFITAIDIKSRYAFSQIYSHLNSQNASIFMQSINQSAPFKVKRVQTDNGSEFAKNFGKLVKNKKIIHYHNYPRSPKSNAYIERFNRTIKEQFIYNNWDNMQDLQTMNAKMQKYLEWYNEEKPHKGIKLRTPKEFLTQQSKKYQKSIIY
jgi:transposase InsO family protein